MKITNAFFEQNNQDSPLIKLCQCTGLPTKVSYWLSRLLQHLEPLNKTYASERKKLIEKWCDKDESGKPKEENGQYFIKEHMQEFNDEYAELLAIELGIDMKIIEIPLGQLPVGVLNSFDYSKLQGIVDFKED